VDSVAEPDDDWYFDNVTYFDEPGGGRLPPGPMVRWQAWWQRAAERAAEDAPGTAAALAATQGFAVTVAQARAAGITRAQARTNVANRVWQAPAPGVLAPIDIRDPDRWLVARRTRTLAATAAALRNPGHVVCAASAADLHGLPTFSAADVPVLTAVRATLGRRGALHARGATLAPAEIESWFGAPVTTVARTVVDLARHDRRDGLIAADAAAHEGALPAAALHAALDRAAGWPGVRAAREVLALTSAKAESPLESLVRLALHDSGFPAPELQVEIRLPGRWRPYRADFLWPAQGLILEADGLGKYSERERQHERRRQAALRRAGYRLERVIWADVVDEWPATSALLRIALGL
jgi:hypothetical protein